MPLPGQVQLRATILFNSSKRLLVVTDDHSASFPPLHLKSPYKVRLFLMFFRHKHIRKVTGSVLTFFM